MKRIIRLTESDLTRIVKRVLKENGTPWSGTKIVQGYGNDPWQYKVVKEKDATPLTGSAELGFYVAKKGSNPKWTKITDEKTIEEIKRLHFTNLFDANVSTRNRNLYADEGPERGKSRIDKLKFAAEKFPCLEREQIKTGGKKITTGDSVIFEINDFMYDVRNDLSGWSVKRMPKTGTRKWMDCENRSGMTDNRVKGCFKSYKSCSEINFNEEKTNTVVDKTECLKNAGFEYQKSSKSPIGTEIKLLSDGYYSKDNFVNKGQTYSYAVAIKSPNSEGFNFKVNLPSTGSAASYVKYGNWSCKTGKLVVTLNDKKVMKTPGEYGF
jgi:hypothetical protein